MKTKNVNRYFFYALWIFYSCVYYVVVASSLKFVIDVQYIYIICQYITILGLATLLLQSHYKLKNLILIISLLAVSLLIMNRSILIVFLFALTARKENMYSFLKLDIVLKLFLNLAIIYLCLLKILPSVQGTYGSVYKESWGFQHPNTLGISVNVMLLEYLILRYKKLNALDVMVILSGWSVVYLIARSRTSCYALILVLILAAISRIDARFFQRKLVKRILILSAPFFAILTIFLTVQYGRNSEPILYLNKLLTGRIYLQFMNWQRYKITLFGQKFDESFSYYLDSGYLRCLLEFGIVYLVLICFLYSRFMKKCMNNSRFEYVLFSLFFIMLGFAESYFTQITVNVSLLMLFNIKLTDQNQIMSAKETSKSDLTISSNCAQENKI